MKRVYGLHRRSQSLFMCWRRIISHEDSKYWYLTRAGGGMYCKENGSGLHFRKEDEGIKG